MPRTDWNIWSAARTVLAGMTLLVLAGCGRVGKTPTPEKLEQIQMGMTLSEVEEILGRGNVYGEDKPNAISRIWGDQTKSIALSFHYGKLVGYQAHGLPGIGPAKNPEAPAAGSPPPGGPSASTQGGSPGRTNDFQVRADLGSIWTHLGAYSQDHNGVLPTKLEELTVLRKLRPDAYSRIEAGMYVVVWGAPSSARVWAYEKDAPEKGGTVATSNGPKKMTAEQVKAALGGATPEGKTPQKAKAEPKANKSDEKYAE